MSRSNRTLDMIAREIHTTLKRETTDIIAIGGLLIEARKHLPHGQWYPWLKENFSLSRQTADRYIKLHRAVAKTPKIGELKLRSTLLEDLFISKRQFPPEVKEAIYKEAESKWVGRERAYEIQREMKQAEIEAVDRGELPPSQDQKLAPEREKRHEQEASPPDLPPAPQPLLPRDELLVSKFTSAINMLNELRAMPSGKFTAASVLSEELELIANFVKQVAAAKKKQTTTTRTP